MLLRLKIPSAAIFPLSNTKPMRLFSSLLLGILALSSCTGAGDSSKENALLHPAAAEILTAELSLRILAEKGATRTVGIVLRNPAEVPVQSVRAWVTFDPKTLFIDNFVVEDGRFSLFAPGEHDIDLKEGFVKFGGAVGAPMTDRETVLASFTVHLPKKPTGPLLLTFHDWQADGSGHTAVLSLPGKVSDATPLGVLNIVQPPSSLAL